jgi:hypothetical protein
MRIDVLGMDGLGLAAEGWRLSREEWVHYPWEEVYSTDCPVTELPSCVLHFHEFPMIIREILASSRTHVMWARTSVEYPTEFKVPGFLSGVVDVDKHDAARKKMEEMRAAGLHRDEWRPNLPMSAVTSFCMRISFRDLVKYAMYFQYLSGVNVKLFRLFLETKKSICHVIDKFTGSSSRTSRCFGDMKLAKFLHEGKMIEAPMVRTAGHYVANFSVPMWIRAHLVRHRPLSIVDDFYQLLLRDDVLDIPISTPIQMEIAATKDFWMTIVSKRTCWLLQTTLSAEKDPWQTIIDGFGEFQRDVLPCRDGKCPYDADAYLRITDYDPSVPCPIHVGFRGLDKSKWVDEMRVAAKGRSPFWRDIIDA